MSTPRVLACGARVTPHYTEGVTDGLRLYAVRPGSLHAALGLRNGDTVLALDGRPLTAPRQALEAYSILRHQHRVELAVRRRNVDLTIVYTVDAPAPADHPAPAPTSSSGRAALPREPDGEAAHR
jgi:general secretion pathway protein C